MDNGDTWQTLGLAPVQNNTSSYHVGNPRIYRVARPGAVHTLYRSPDFGLTFASLGPIGTDANANHLAVIRLASGTVLVAIVSDGVNLRVARSVNEGASWTIINVFAQNAFFLHHQLFEPVPGTIIGQYTLGGFCIFMRSTDDGLTWPSRTFYQPTAATIATGMFVVPGTGTLLNHSYDIGTGTHFLHRSVDLGATWVQVNSDALAMAVEPAGRGALSCFVPTGRLWWIGKWRSNDDGLTWAIDATMPGGGAAVLGALGAQTTTTALTASANQIWSTKDNGATWVSRLNPLDSNIPHYMGGSEFSPAVGKKTKKYGGFASPFVPVSS